MAADFMAQPGLLRNKLTTVFFGTVAFLFSCGHKLDLVPAVFFDTAQVAFIEKSGIAYVNGKPYNGWEISLFENGDTALAIPFLNGKKEGIAREWYANGQLKNTGAFKNGNREGEHRGWYASGNPAFIRHYNRDIYEGEVKEWFASGSLFKNFHYKNGQEAGMQQQYFANGLLQFNYQALNGRNYGLTGVKNCVNVADSVNLR